MKRTVFTMDIEESSFSCLKFLADGMLGSLARWLRFLGYDTVFHQDWTKGQLLSLAKTEGRIFLTRDRAFAQKSRPFPVIFVSSEDVGDQLKQVVVDLNLDPVSHRFSLCSLCNVSVKSVKKDEVADSVPKAVWERESVFWECPCCGRIYWQGGHWQRIEARLAALHLNKRE